MSSRIELLCDRFYVLFLPVCYYLSWLLWRGDLRLLLWWSDAQVLGVIDQPVLRERWIGRQGHATTMNGNNIHSRSSCTALKNAYLYVLPRCTSVSLNLPHIICCNHLLLSPSWSFLASPNLKTFTSCYTEWLGMVSCKIVLLHPENIQLVTDSNQEI